MPRPVSALCASPNDSVLALGFKEVSGLGRTGERERMRPAGRGRWRETCEEGDRERSREIE